MKNKKTKRAKRRNRKKSSPESGAERRQETTESKRDEKQRRSSSQDRSARGRSYRASDDYIKRVNGKFIGIGLGIVLATLVGIHLLHAYQVQRNADALLERATQAEDRAEPEEAIKFLGRYVRLRPDDAQNQLRLAYLIDRHGESLRDAQRVFFSLEETLTRHYDKLDPQEVIKARAHLVSVAMQLREYKHASHHLERLLEARDSKAWPDDDQEIPDLPQMLFLQGMCRRADNEPLEAAQFYLTAISEQEALAADSERMGRVEYYTELVDLLGDKPEQIPSREDLGEVDDVHYLKDYEKENPPIADRLVSIFPREHEIEVDELDESPSKSKEEGKGRREPVGDFQSDEPDSDELENGAGQKEAETDADDAELPPLRPDVEHAEFERVAKELMALMRERGKPKEDAYLAHAEYHLRGKRLDAARADVEEALQEAPEEPDVLLVAARVELQQAEQWILEDALGNKEDALAAIEKAEEFAEKGLEGDPNDLRFHTVLYQADLVALRYGEDNTTVARHYLAAAAEMRKAIDKLPDARDEAKQIDDKTERKRTQALLNLLEADFRWNLVDVLVSHAEVAQGKAQAESFRKVEGMLTDLRRKNINRTMLRFLRTRLAIARLRAGKADPDTDPTWHVVAQELEILRPQLESRRDLARRVNRLLGHCYTELNNPDRRLAVYRRAFREDPEWTQGRMQLAAALVANNKIDEAIREYDLLLRHDKILSVPLTVAALRIEQQLRLPQERRNWQRVERPLEIARKISPESVQVGLLTASYYSARGEVERAFASLQEAQTYVQNDDEEATVAAALAALELQRPDTDQADRIQRAQQILREAAGEVGNSVILQRAEINMVARQPQEQAVASLRAIESELDRYSPAERIQLKRTLAGTYSSLGEPNKALSLWEEIADAEPLNLDSRLIGAELATKLFDEQAAERFLREIRQIEGPSGPSGNFTEASWLMAKALKETENVRTDARFAEREKRLKEARRLLQAAISDRPQWVAAVIKLADLEKYVGNRTAAYANYRKALNLGNRSTRVVGYVADYLAKTNQLRESLETLMRYGSETPQGLRGPLGALASQAAFGLEQYERGIELATVVADDLEEDQYQKDLTYGRLRLIEYGTLTVEERVSERGVKLLEEGKGFYRKAIEKSGNSPDVWIRYIAHLVQIGKVRDAETLVAQLDENISADPPYQRPLTQAVAYEMLKNRKREEGQSDYLELATAAYQEAIAADPKNVALHIRAAEFYNRNGDTDGLRKELLWIADPKNEAPGYAITWARTRQALLASMGGTYDESTKALEELRDAKTETDAERLLNLKTQAGILSRRSTKKDRRELIEVLEAIDEIEPLGFADRFQLARLYDAVADPDTAMKILRRLEQEQPTNPLVKAYYIHVLLGKGDAEALEAAGSLLAELEPSMDDSLAIVYLKARLHAEKGQPELAVPIVRDYLRRISNAASASSFQSPEAALRDLVAQERAGEALSFLAQQPGIQDDPESQQALADGKRLLDNGNVEEALVILRRFLQRRDFVVALHLVKFRLAAALLSELGQHKDAREVFEAYLKHKPASQRSDEDELLLIGYLGREGRIAAALDRLEKLTDKIAPVAFANSAVAIIRTGQATNEQAARVERWLVRLAADNPDIARIDVHLADLRDFQGKYDEAEQVYRQILERDDSDAMALNNLAWLLAVRGSSVEEALRLINRAIAQVGPLAELLDTRATVHIAANRPKAALQDLRAAIDSSPTAVKYFHLALAHWQNKDEKAAREAFTKALEKDFTIEQLHPLEHESYRRMQSRLGRR